MKITIRPLIEIDTDGKYCGKECANKRVWMTGFFKFKYYCEEPSFKNTNLVVSKNKKCIRCQACLDAEKAAEKQ